MKYPTSFLATVFCALALVIAAKYIPLNADVSAQQDNNSKDGKGNQSGIRHDNQPKVSKIGGITIIPRGIVTPVPDRPAAKPDDNLKIEPN